MTYIVLKAPLNSNQPTNLKSSMTVNQVVKSRVIYRLTSNKLLNPHQSAYCKHHSTESALLYIHDHLINAIGSQNVPSFAFLISLLPLTL